MKLLGLFLHAATMLAYLQLWLQLQIMDGECHATRLISLSHNSVSIAFQKLQSCVEFKNII